MAGVGFRLRKIVDNSSYTHILRAYAYSSILTSAGWLYAIVVIVFIDKFINFGPNAAEFVLPFKVSVTYLISSSLIFSGLIQGQFTRYISDRLFEKANHRIIPNFFGSLIILSAASFIVGFLLSLFLFPKQSFLLKLIMTTTFVELNLIWVATSFLTGLKNYLSIMWIFILSYSCVFISAYYLRHYELIGLLFSFFIGQFILLTAMITLTVNEYPSNKLVEFDFLHKNRVRPSLLFIIAILNIGIWIDKYLFWYWPNTSHQVLGGLRASSIYDLPMFLAFITIIPGLSVFMFRVEADFSRYFHYFYRAITNGGTLHEIAEKRNVLVERAKEGLFDVIKIQMVVLLLIYVFGPALLRLLHMDPLHLYLLRIDCFSVSLLAILIGLLNILSYIDKRPKIVLITVIFVFTNFVFTLLTLAYLGAFYYGYGFAASLTVTVTAALWITNYEFEHLIFTTFMES